MKIFSQLVITVFTFASIVQDLEKTKYSVNRRWLFSSTYDRWYFQSWITYRIYLFILHWTADFVFKFFVMLNVNPPHRSHLNRQSQRWPLWSGKTSRRRTKTSCCLRRWSRCRTWRTARGRAAKRPSCSRATSLKNNWDSVQRVTSPSVRDASARSTGSNPALCSKVCTLFQLFFL